MVIFTVYRPEDNLDYLKDWLDYHTKLGITAFYMYDNAGGGGNTGMKQQKINPQFNKNGVKNKYTPQTARELQKEIFKDYNVFHTVWEPKDSEGNITYNWDEASQDFALKFKEGLCAFIDIDEFIIKKEEFKESRLMGKNYKSRTFYNTIYDCNKQCKISMDTKCIINMKNFPDFSKIPTSIKWGSQVHFHFLSNLPLSKSHYNHYNITKFRLKKFFQIPEHLKNTSFENMFITVDPLKPLK